MMVALLLYAYSRGVYSSRRIARGLRGTGGFHGGQVDKVTGLKGKAPESIVRVSISDREAGP
jgi:hypothetical protein